jgi:hypothetical protein
MIQRVKLEQNFGSDVLKMAKNPLRAMNVLEGLQQAEHPKMLKPVGLQSTKIGDRQCEN